MNKIRTASFNDAVHIDKVIKKYSLNKEIVNSLLNINCVLCLEDESSNILSIAIFAIAISGSGEESIIKVIGIDSLSNEHTISILHHISCLSTTVHISKKCIEFEKIKLATNIDSNWYKLNLNLKKFVNKVVIPRKYYTKNFLEFSRKARVISNSIFENKKELISYENSNKIKELFDSGFIKDYGNGVYSFKMFSEEFCKYVLSRAKKCHYEVNDIEESPYQMPEVVLADKDVKLYEETLEIFNSHIPQITKCLYYAESKNINSIQLAKYSKETISKGNWHFDEDSDITLVATLNNNYSGGGTKIKPYGYEEEIVINSLEPGECLLFRGKHLLHKGLQVESGERNILVFWTES